MLKKSQGHGLHKMGADMKLGIPHVYLFLLPLKPTSRFHKILLNFFDTYDRFPLRTLVSAHPSPLGVVRDSRLCRNRVLWGTGMSEC